MTEPTAEKLSNSNIQKHLAEEELQLAFIKKIKFSVMPTAQVAENQLIFENCSVNLDLVLESETHIIIAEIYSHIGSALPGQRKKITNDILKLIFVSDLIESESTVKSKKNGSQELDYTNKIILKYLIFGCDKMAKMLTSSSSWAAEAAKFYGIRAEVLPFSEETQTLILKQQQRQKEGMKKS